MRDISNYKLPDCYIYFYHTDEYLILPQYPDQIADTLNSTFASQNALSRTAPVFSYSNSGPRTVQVTLKLHRDIMNYLNKDGSNISLNGIIGKPVRYNQGGDIIYNVGDDYVDVLCKKLQAVALPKYQASDKMVTPPMIAVRFGDEVFIKGVVASGVSVSYELPLLENGKYANIIINFNVSEIQPYDAESVGELGSFRGLTAGLKQLIGDRKGSV